MQRFTTIHLKSDITNVEDNLVFLTLKVVNSDKFSFVSDKQEMHISLFRETTNEKKQFKKNKKKHGYLIHT